MIQNWDKCYWLNYTIISYQAEVSRSFVSGNKNNWTVLVGDETDWAVFDTVNNNVAMFYYLLNKICFKVDSTSGQRLIVHNIPQEMKQFSQKRDNFHKKEEY